MDSEQSRFFEAASAADLGWRRLLAPRHVDPEWLGENCVAAAGAAFYLWKQTVATATLPARRLSLRHPHTHQGPGSIHPDGGFIFVLVCLLIHASNYSGHRRGFFVPPPKCKSPRRLIHFHPSLVDIQLLSTCRQGFFLFFLPLPPPPPTPSNPSPSPVQDVPAPSPANLPAPLLASPCVKCNRVFSPPYPPPTSPRSLSPIPPPDPGATAGLAAG